MAEYLPQVNIEAVYGEYTTDLNGFLKSADSYVKTTFADNVADSMATGDVLKDEEGGRSVPEPIEGGGWVIELRGYTEHESGYRFLNGALLKNLQRFDDFAKLTKQVGSEEDKLKDLLPGTKDPVDGTVSHAMLLVRYQDQYPQQGQFKYINQSVVRALIQRAGGTGGGMGGEGMIGGRGDPTMGVPSMDGGDPSGDGTTAPGTINPPWSPISPVTPAAVTLPGGTGGEGMMPGGGRSGPALEGWTTPREVANRRAIHHNLAYPTAGNSQRSRNDTSSSPSSFGVSQRRLT